MKRERSRRLNKQTKPDDKFAGKVLSQLLVSIVIFTLVFVNSVLTNDVSVAINQKIKHYLTTSIDFDKTVEVAKTYFEGFWNRSKTTPVNSEPESETKDES